MKIISTLFLLVLILSWTTFSCSHQDDNYADIVSISVDLTKIPYEKLSDYNFFKGEIKLQNPANKVLIYQPASSLFTDYAYKKRFVWMPNGTIATYNGDDKVLELPVGAALVKTFYYNNVQPSNSTKIIETRIMIRKENGWIFAEYVWNEEQTEAFLTTEGSNKNITWKDENNILKTANYRIPSPTECLICHKSNAKPIPIGIKPQNLNNLISYNGSSKNQLSKWIEENYLENNLLNTITATVDYNDTSKSLSLRARSYVDINCAHCHQNNSHCDYRPMRFAFSETSNPTNLGVCVIPQDTSVNPALTSIVAPNNKNRSMLYYRLNTTDESFRMPLLGRSVIHQEGIELMEQWINSLPPCN
jgi:uncharacterized repeat protein (TIGR03806 family)